MATQTRARRRPAALEPLESRRLMAADGDHLAFTRQIWSAVAGHPVGANDQAVAVTLFDAGGAFDAGYDGTVTLALSGDNPGTLTGTLSGPAVGGYADFTDLTFSNGGDYTLTATDDRGDVVDAAITVHVSSVNTRAAVTVVGQPTLDAATGTVSLTVGVVDGAGTLVPNDETDPAVGSAGVVALTVKTGPDGGYAFDDAGHSGTMFATINPDGTQTFAGLKVTAAGRYTFEVSDATPVSVATTASVDLPASTPPPAPPAAAGPPSGRSTWPHVGGIVDPILFQSGTPVGATTTATPVGGVTTTPRAGKRAAARAARAERTAARRAAHAAAVAQRAARLAALAEVAPVNG